MAKLLQKRTDMLSQATFSFLTELKVNNQREWFHEHKPRFKQAQENMLAMANELIDRIIDFDERLMGTEGKDCLFRIYRDTRFSKNKAPYKTNMGASMAPGGRKSILPGYYLNIEPGNCFVAGGNYRPDSPQLKAIRNLIEQKPEALRAAIDDPTFVDRFGALQGESLKTAPKGYPKDHPDIDLLRRKGFIAYQTFDDATALGDDFPDLVEASFQDMFPLIQFLHEAIDG
ncbi:MAG: DUF2461 domain-containing protein [Bacteroidota bacterium]